MEDNVHLVMMMMMILMMVMVMMVVMVMMMMTMFSKQKRDGCRIYLNPNPFLRENLKFGSVVGDKPEMIWVVKNKKSRRIIFSHL